MHAETNNTTPVYREPNEPRRGNTIAIWALVVNSLIMLISLGIWYFTLKASILSERAFNENMASNKSSDSVARETLNKYESLATATKEASEAAA